MSAPLDKLHDFYQPSPPAWTPQTAGWYTLFAVVGLLLIWAIVHLVRTWFANRYRRVALRELPLLQPSEFSALLKRTALAAWPREKSLRSVVPRGSTFSMKLLAPKHFTGPHMIRLKSWLFDRRHYRMGTNMPLGAQ
jgi:hypothetical protein